MQKIIQESIAAAALLLAVSTVSAETNAEQGTFLGDDAKVQVNLSQFKPSVPKVGGLVNGRYTYDTGTKDNDGNSYNGFDLRRARLSVTGDFGKSIDYRIQAEFGGGKQNSSATVRLLDAYARFKFAKELNLQVGEYKVAYSQETLDGPTSWLTIENPTVVSKLNGYSDVSGQSANGRDVGLRLYGSFIHKEGYSIIGYKVGVYNGNGINLKDNNSFKDVETYITVNPIKELTLSFGNYIGRYTKDASSETAKRNRLSAGFTYNPGKLFVRSEYLHGKTGDTNQQGFYATAAYRLPYGLQPVLSYGYYQKDTKAKQDNQSDYTVGVNWSVNKWIRVQLDYTHTDYTNSDKKNSNLLETQLLVAF